MQNYWTAVHTLHPAKGEITRTTPRDFCCCSGNSSARTSQPDIPKEIARKQKRRSMPFSKATLQGTALTANGK